ncbi:hypothetical protein [Yinghuangia sp. YIM S09857]|uniref:hypothetical protein n=1 Tax=Yinghuangia sp. YIM S09857 TaxID=3436929 RepID=UPI003F52F893
MAKQKAKPHLQDKSPMFAEPAHRADADRAQDRPAHERSAQDRSAQDRSAQDRSAQDRSQAQDRASDTLVADHDAQQNRRAKGRKQTRGSDTGPKGRKRH